jgi:hypothetical protein
MEFTVAGLTTAGFQGFLSVRGLGGRDCDCVPEAAGVYATLTPSTAAPVFLPRSPAGPFRRRDPTVPEAFLRSQWVPGAQVIYIGRAACTDRTDLRQRLRKFLAFGGGRAVAHWGGRLIWQLGGSSDFILAWMPCQDYRRMEADLLAAFRAAYGALPFANLREESGV